MEFLLQRLHYLQIKVRSVEQAVRLEIVRHHVSLFLEKVRSIGVTARLGEYEKRKLRVFNQLNFFLLVTGFFVSVTGVLNNKSLQASAWLVASLPPLVSVLVLHLNHRQRYEYALLAYFILYPFFTCVVYLNGMNLGSELSFILCSVLSVFFLRNRGYMLFAIAFSMISYFIMYVVWKQFQYGLAAPNMGVYRINHALGLAYILYGLYLIKRENTDYQFRILEKNRSLHRKNLEILAQKEEIGQKARLLKMQTEELKESNATKNKLFSVISHDLKTPMYALRNLFRNAHQHNLPAEEIKALMPEVMNDLNDTIGLMENLLQWSKSQMEGYRVKTESVDLTHLIDEVASLLRPQAEAKRISVEHVADGPVLGLADRHMINLVLRNLLSNAIKFTPQGGSVTLGTNDMESAVEVYVQDTGKGISAVALQKILDNDYYSTRGTAQESGTGLGLMLCREFLTRNNSRLHIDTQPGSGSTFSFALPCIEEPQTLPRLG